MSLFQFAAAVEGYNRAHSGAIEPPTADELEAAIAWSEAQEARDGERR